MSPIGTDRISRWDQHGREHVVRVRHRGMRRTISCETCGWHRGAPFAPWPKAVEHLAGAHQATVDPAGPRQPSRRAAVDGP
ncbi:hypothetical protein ACWDFL_18910 [Streptomyces bungoensis]